MARNRKTDHDSAIAAALKLFWARGYSGSSTREIEEQTGLTRFTLQTAYGGKEGFFLDTLDAYLEHAEAQFFPNPETFDLDALAGWFEQLTDKEYMPDVDQCGCLAFNSINEFERCNADVNARIERYLASFESRALQILKKTERNGELSKGIETEVMARVLMDLLLGLHVIIKARTDDDVPRAHARSIAVLIRSWRNNS